MKSKLIFLLAVLAFACSDESKYLITGKITNAEGKYIYLDELKLTSRVNIDSMKIDKNGQFKFKGEVGIPTYFLLGLDDKERNFITLLVDSAERVEVYGDMANFSQNYIVTGSEGSILVQELDVRLRKTKYKLDSINTLMTAYRLNPEEQKKWEGELEEIKQAQMEYSKNFVMEHPFSMANVLVLYQKFDDDNYVIQELHSLKVAASALNSCFPGSEFVKALYADTERLMKDEKMYRLREYMQEYGDNSPDIVLPDPNGKEIALSSLRGKYVLLQFWAGANPSSRVMNPVLADLYKLYRNKGFEIYQVSLDTNKTDWINAINEDQLTWINVGDGAGSRNAALNYVITEIPYNYLLDKEGKVIVKNIKGPALTNLLKSLF